ncbi:unnamed protein product [Kuraishia capsulata CBS 1993]|uniref:RRM domain-containing protein n=1 Tax=Kuraishia capsulata CBS 1993 TaxID=1382522 RepID=W6MQU7_9ASCO|nr:uncharacterized protein KUCA_T00005033001 [Kuraishia capsulata CBS 1993]CDK29046.1 unnamed protein product [Kuraishia capsulata CBS 1993]
MGVKSKQRIAPKKAAGTRRAPSKKIVAAKEIVEEKAEEEFELPSSSEDEDFGGFSDSADDEEIAEIPAETISEPQPSSAHTVIKPKQKLQKSQEKTKTKRGIIYVGRIPHGFYEEEMKKYFQQFGEITRLRLSRNKKTGKSKHYGFIEFALYEVAKIAAETMNNYLIFGHILKCSLVPKENLHEDIFNGANTKFKVVPWAKIARRKNDAPKTLEKWTELEKTSELNKQKKQQQLKSKGIDYDLSSL